MAYLQIVGFETGDESECSPLVGTASIQNTIVDESAYALRTNPTDTDVGYARLEGHDSTGAFFDLNAPSVVFLSFRFRFATAPSSNDEPIAALLTTAGVKLEVALHSSGILKVYDSALSILGTGTTVLSPDTWCRIGIKMEIGTGVAWAVEINGASELSGTGTFSSVQFVHLGKHADRHGNSVDFYFDNAAINNSEMPPPGIVRNLAPTGDGTYTAWTIGAGSGSDWQQIDEIPHDGDSSYLLDTGIGGQASTATLQTSTEAGVDGTVHAVKSWIIGKRDATSNCAGIVRLRSGSVNSDASGALVSSSYILRAKLHNTDPATSSSWTLSGLDTLQTGAISAGFPTELMRLTATGAMVYFTPALIVSGIDPNSGPVAGGQTVTITGAGFVSGATVLFDADDATDVDVVSAGEITCVTPAHSAGTVDVTVTNPDSSSDTLAEGYEFVTPGLPGDFFSAMTGF